MKKKNKDKLKDSFLIISSFLVGGITMLLIARFTPLISSQNTIITKNGTKVYEKTSLASSIEKVYDAVMVVQSYYNSTLKTTGTAFVYKVDDNYGYLLTNEHVITDSNSVKLVTTSNEEVEAKVLGKDEYLDLAVLRIEKKYVKLIATLGKSEDMNLGDTVFAVGTPVSSEYRGSVTSGILSGKDRMVKTNVSSSSNIDWVMRVLQIDASINPGNSGGPILNVNGEVIGICTMKLMDTNIEGMGFAIPIEYALSHISSLENGKEIKWPVIGIGMANINDESSMLKYDINLKTKLTEGVVVLSVNDNAKSALQKGDIITKINDTNIKDMAYLRYELYRHQAGETIEITLERNGHIKTTKLKLASSK